MLTLLGTAISSATSESNKRAAAFEALVLMQTPRLCGKSRENWLSGEKLCKVGGQKICPPGKKDAASTLFLIAPGTGRRPKLVGFLARISRTTRVSTQITHWRDVCCAECQMRPNNVRRHDHAGSHRYSHAGIRCSAKGSSRVLDHCRTKTTCSSCAIKAAGTRTVIVEATFAKQRHRISKTVITGTRTVRGA
jgi:hypothetical protein